MPKQASTQNVAMENKIAVDIGNTKLHIAFKNI